MTEDEKFADLVDSYPPPKRGKEADGPWEIREEPRQPWGKQRKRRNEPHRIDLHCMTVDEAIYLLNRELPKKQTKRPDVKVHIIHGKGHGSPGGEPVLKDKVREWLRMQRERGLVTDFRPGERNEGGEGVTVCYLNPKTKP